MNNKVRINMDKAHTYSELSQQLTKSIDKKRKKNNGIYFTPPKTVYENLKYLEPYLEGVKEVLEPSCGSGEYIIQLKEHENMNITGVEKNKTIFDSIKGLKDDKLMLINDDFLTHDFKWQKYDLIIGNPPYFVMKKDDVDDSYYEYFDGRPNIFILFIIRSLELLNDGGIISFVLPKNFLNCLYYDKTRKLLAKNYRILNIMECNDKYLETQQDTIILIIQNEEPNENNESHSIVISDYTIFGTPSNITSLKKLYTNSKTLFDLNFNVSVGNIVWNQVKKELTDDSDETLLIYSSDIKNNELSIMEYSNKAKKNYIRKEGSRDPLLVINRGYGVGSYNFNYCIINENDNIEYLIENHLICIKYTKALTKEKLIEKYKQLIESFKNEKTKEFIEIYFGNNAINTTELCKILPIYDI